ncbi:GDSL esterase/lipase [Capsicum annuum]
MALAIRVLVLSMISLVILQRIKGDAPELIKLQKPRLMNCRFNKLYQLGDSLSDTGNCIRDRNCEAHLDCRRFPYGMNFFHNATGRCSDGMLTIDFIALESGLPLLNPYKLPSANFKHGANFAVASATALSTEIMAEKKIFNPMTNNSLNVQLDWMSSHFETTCFPDCPKKLKKSLILLGEIGGNEFNYGLLQRKTIEELRKMVPDVVQTITHGVKRAIGFGATRIIVPGNFPIGCVPIFLTQFRTDNSTAYDEYHCLKNLNNFAIFYNHYLQQAIDELKKEYPNITLVYGDYYNAYMWLLKNAVRLVLSVISLVILQEKGNAEELLVKLKKPSLMNCRFDKIYQFGDSLSDTGNCIRESHCGARTACRRLPYGMNFYRKATGRCSDGMLMIDFIALESGLPLLNPYKDRNANFGHGVNFAVAGATALSSEFLAENKIVNTALTNSSLSVQLDWMSSHFQTTCSPDCPGKLKKSLFLVGEIGGNDFCYGLLQGKTMDESRRMVPRVVQTIIHGVRTVIDFGATTIVVPGISPLGCLPVFLTKFTTTNSTAYDEYHCLKDINDLAIFHNHYLQQATDELKKQYPNVTLIYGDCYNAYMWLLQNAVRLGFDDNSLQKACCGMGGEYNYDVDKKCGSPGVPVCVDPSTYISWDGAHLTQNAYSWLARRIIDDILPKLSCKV